MNPKMIVVETYKYDFDGMDKIGNPILKNKKIIGKDIYYECEICEERYEEFEEAVDCCTIALRRLTGD